MRFGSDVLAQSLHMIMHATFVFERKVYTSPGNYVVLLRMTLSNKVDTAGEGIEYILDCILTVFAV